MTHQKLIFKTLYTVVILIATSTSHFATHFSENEYKQLMKEKSPLKILGLNSSDSSNPQKIKKAYKKLAKKYHPDRNPKDKNKANEAMQKINQAYEPYAGFNLDNKISFDELLIMTRSNDFFWYFALDKKLSWDIKNKEDHFVFLFLCGQYIDKGKTILHHYHEAKEHISCLIQLETLIKKKNLELLGPGIIKNTINAVDYQNETFLYKLLKKNNKTHKDFSSLFEILSCEDSIEVDVNTHPSGKPMPIALFLKSSNEELFRIIKSNFYSAMGRKTAKDLRDYGIALFLKKGLDMEGMAYVKKWRIKHTVKGVIFGVLVAIVMTLMVGLGMDAFTNEFKITRSIWNKITKSRNKKSKNKENDTYKKERKKENN